MNATLIAERIKCDDCIAYIEEFISEKQNRTNINLISIFFPKKW